MASGLMLLILFAVICWGIGRTFGGISKGSNGSGLPRPHPNLKECPGCGTRLTGESDTCPKCGLRVSY